MSEDEHKSSPEQNMPLEEYIKAINWLRDHVAPDDIYEFAQQVIMAAECLIVSLHNHGMLKEDYKTDHMMSHWVSNILSIQIMKDNNFSGILDVSWRKEE